MPERRMPPAGSGRSVKQVAGAHLRRVAGGFVLAPFLGGGSAVFLLPLVIMARYSFLQVRSYRVVYEPSFATWISLVESGRWIAIVRTLRVAFAITVIEFLLAFPFAIWLAKICRSKPLKAIIVTLLTIPFFLDASSRVI